MAAVYGSVGEYVEGKEEWALYLERLEHAVLRCEQCKREGTKASHFAFHNRTKNVPVA